MDSSSLEFWGQLFLNAAKSRKQMDELNNLVRQGFTGYDSLTAMLKKAYGLDTTDRASETEPDYMQLWEKSTEDFQSALREYLAMFDMVPKKDYLVLAEKHEDLRKKCEEQEQAIIQHRNLLKEKGENQGRGVDEFKELLEKQSSEFQDLLKNLSVFFQAKKDKS